MTTLETNPLMKTMGIPHQPGEHTLWILMSVEKNEYVNKVGGSKTLLISATSTDTKRIRV